MKDFDARIKQWNMDRNGLAFDLALEKKMLTEEIIEFLQAPDLPNKIKELCDIAFVGIGTHAKLGAQQDQSAAAAAELYECTDWLESTVKYFNTALQRELAAVLREDVVYHDFMSKCMDFVITANEAKGTEKDEFGKVKKGPNYKKPEPLIAALIEENKR